MKKKNNTFKGRIYLSMNNMPMLNVSFFNWAILLCDIISPKKLFSSKKENLIERIRKLLAFYYR